MISSVQSMVSFIQMRQIKLQRNQRMSQSPEMCQARVYSRLFLRYQREQQHQFHHREEESIHSRSLFQLIQLIFFLYVVVHLTDSRRLLNQEWIRVQLVSTLNLRKRATTMLERCSIRRFHRILSNSVLFLSLQAEFRLLFRQIRLMRKHL